jgi:hypothetical protein
MPILARIKQGRLRLLASFYMVLLLTLLDSRASAGEAAHDKTSENQEAVKEFGIEAGQPITSGFVFIDTLYVHLPYVVERRGLSTWINGHKVIEGIDWPLHNNEVVATDPGDPPPGVSPFDASRVGDSDYWGRKISYVNAHNDSATAKALIIAAFRKSGLFVSVTEIPDRLGSIEVVDTSGERSSIRIVGDTGPDGIQDPAEALAGAVKDRTSLESALRAGTILGFRIPGMRWRINHASSMTFLEILGSSATPTEKSRDLVNHKLAPPNEVDLIQYFLTLFVDDELKGRIARFSHGTQSSRTPRENVEPPPPPAYPTSPASRSGQDPTPNQQIPTASSKEAPVGVATWEIWSIAAATILLIIMAIYFIKR